MGIFDKAKRLFGLGGGDEDEHDVEAAAEAHDAAPPREGVVGSGGKRRDRADRPPLVDAPPPSQSIDDALELRDAGDLAGARKLLAEIDRGGGLRTVLRGAAALEAGDEDELAKLMPAIVSEANGHRLLLQVAAALDDAAAAARLVSQAEARGAPAWALAWTRAMSEDEATRRTALVELLFADAALARTVAARDVDVAAAVPDPNAAQRYASFAHGRDSVRRFGAASVAKLVARALGDRT